MLIVCVEEARVEAELAGGLLGCPSCRGVLGPWGWARARVLRCPAGDGRWCRGGRAVVAALGGMCCCRAWRCCGGRTSCR
jgi:hypothetical protein